MTFEQIMSELKGGKFRPIYLLMGEEPYYTDQVADYIAAHALQEHEKAFNQTVMYGKDSTINQVLDAVRQYPMGAQRQVVIVKEAQELIDPSDKRTKGKLDKLEFYAERPLASTVLVVCYKYKTIDKRSKIYKLLDKTAAVMESKALYENKVPSWIDKYLSERGYSIAPDASQLLTEYLGTALSKIACELDKLVIVLAGSPVREITTEHIEKNVGISKDYNVFELQKALGSRNVLKSNRIIQHFAANPKEIPRQSVITNLFSYFMKVMKLHYIADKSHAVSELGIKPNFLKDYETAARNYPAGKVVQVISVLREYDLKSKGSSTTAGDLMREMVYRILH